jgi:hypothetical protein
MVQICTVHKNPHILVRERSLHDGLHKTESTGSHSPPSDMLAALPTHIILMGINRRRTRGQNYSSCLTVTKLPIYSEVTERLGCLHNRSLSFL